MSQPTRRPFLDETMTNVCVVTFEDGTKVVMSLLAGAAFATSLMKEGWDVVDYPLKNSDGSSQP